MAAITALAHLGFPHPNDGGLRPEYLFQLSEGDRPAWVLEPSGVLKQDEDRLMLNKPLVWIPTVEHMAEDLLVMIGIHIIRDAKLTELCRLHGVDPLAGHLELYSLPLPLRESLYARCRAYEGGWKLALTIFDGSGVESSLSALNEYGCQLEVCRSSFVRYFDRWDEGRTKVQGSLVP